MLIRLSESAENFMMIDDVRTALRIDYSDLDQYLGVVMAAERRRYEDFTGRMMLPTSFEQRMCGWSNPIDLDAVPVREVTSVKYVDTDEVLQTVDSDDWYFERTTTGGQVQFKSSFSSPSLSLEEVRPVRVFFDAGYDYPYASGAGDDPELVAPEVDKSNVILMISKVIYHGEAMTFDEMRATMGYRRVFT